MSLLLASHHNQTTLTDAWNPNDKASLVTLADNNLTATMTQGNGVRGGVSHSSGSGKFYFEVSLVALEAGGTYPPAIGICQKSDNLVTPWTSTGGELTFSTDTCQN